MTDSADGPGFSKIQGLPEEVRNVICNAQVVTSLSGAVKELLDNAIDAEATNIEIRLTENGANILEVIDNGKGIAEENFEFLAKKHCTSKFRDMKDMDNLETFGFRGEALNALTTFSKVIITTKTQAAPVATRLTYNLSNIQKKEKTSGKNGTSIQVCELFQALPVRRHELLKNAKKEYTNLVHCIQAFALARPDIKFTCSNFVKGKKISVLSTPGGKASLKDAISTLFGVRADTDNLLEISDILPDPQIRSLYGITGDGDRRFDVLQIHGHISSTESGLGSHTADRQFLFVNKRHVDYPAASKLINDLYRGYNKKRYAVFVIFVTVHPSRVNVNITPDKRTIQLRDEPIFFAKLRAALQNAFVVDKGTYTPISQPLVASNIVESPKLSQMWSVKMSESQMEAEQEVEVIASASTTKEPSIISKEKNERMPASGFASTLPPQPKDILPKNLLKRPSDIVQANAASAKKSKSSHNTSGTSSRSSSSHMFKSLWATPLPIDMDVSTDASEIVEDHDEEDETIIDKSEMKRRMLNASQEMDESLYDNGKIFDETVNEDIDEFVFDNDVDDIEIVNSDDEDAVVAKTQKNRKAVKKPRIQRNPFEELIDDLPESYFGYIQRENEDSELENIRTCHQELRSPAEIGHEEFLEAIKLIVGEKENSYEQNNLSFDVADDSDKIASEEDTKVVIQKKDFEQMEVLWQFNKSFIFCNLDKHIFIVDQHAADEKTNFEAYIKTARLKRQLLIVPINLSLSPVHEQVLRNNIDIFYKNGFDFRFNDYGEKHQLQLTSVPDFIGIKCGVDEIEEILSHISEGDSPDSNFRPEKVLKGFASKACRRSVMVGDQLELKQMEKLVKRLGALDKPWNCPHGRPTVRLLKINLPPSPISHEKQMVNDLARQFANFNKPN